MITKEQEITLRKVLSHYGAGLQQTKAIEECAELVKAITDYQLKSPVSAPKQIEELEMAVIEEVADVMIMATQLAMIFGKHKVQPVIDYKVKRIAKRIGA